MASSRFRAEGRPRGPESRQNEARMIPDWPQSDLKMIPKWHPKCPQSDPKMTPKWSQSHPHMPNVTPKATLSWPQSYIKWFKPTLVDGVFLKMNLHIPKVTPKSQSDPKSTPFAASDPKVTPKWSPSGPKVTRPGPLFAALASSWPSSPFQNMPRK